MDPTDCLIKSNYIPARVWLNFSLKHSWQSEDPLQIFQGDKEVGRMAPVQCNDDGCLMTVQCSLAGCANRTRATGIACMQPCCVHVNVYVYVYVYVHVYVCMTVLYVYVRVCVSVCVHADAFKK